MNIRINSARFTGASSQMFRRRVVPKTRRIDKIDFISGWPDGTQLIWSFCRSAPFWPQSLILFCRTHDPDMWWRSYQILAEIVIEICVGDVKRGHWLRKIGACRHSGNVWLWKSTRWGYVRGDLKKKQRLFCDSILCKRLTLCGYLNRDQKCVKLHKYQTDYLNLW